MAAAANPKSAKTKSINAGRRADRMPPKLTAYAPLATLFADAAIIMAPDSVAMGIPDTPPCARLITKGSMSVAPTRAASTMTPVWPKALRIHSVRRDTTTKIDGKGDGSRNLQRVGGRNPQALGLSFPGPSPLIDRECGSQRERCAQCGRKRPRKPQIKKSDDDAQTHIHDCGGSDDACGEVGLRHGSLPLALCQHHRGCRRGVKPAHDRRKQSQIWGGDVVLEQITEIGQRADRNHRQPHMIGRERRGRGYRLIGDEGKNDTNQNQEFPRGQQFVPRNDPDQPMQLLARADEQHSSDGDSDRYPGRLCQRDRPDQISYQAGNGNDQRRRSRRVCRAPQMSVQPQRQCNEAGDERQRAFADRSGKASPRRERAAEMCAPRRGRSDLPAYRLPRKPARRTPRAQGRVQSFRPIPAGQARRLPWTLPYRIQHPNITRAPAMETSPIIS